MKPLGLVYSSLNGDFLPRRTIVNLVAASIRAPFLLFSIRSITEVGPSAPERMRARHPPAWSR